uniref:Uncharacterized protein n=1 Tax=Parascaris univalens TaxID=6257 RepID=A0A915CBP1_PARUN
MKGARKNTFLEPEKVLVLPLPFQRSKKLDFI